ncbi:hypothetical protein D7D52_15195 [Nocardia yunnanensis]|uniref:Uncharacterized protein n=1 Tax=Nocardia yunnanensis TaxID=2382165 RepID=A0A386ZBH9_9NOCA|nr:hypothetical protein [Nocardia yunnanensis]AYF74980.1 hypothetical protein D7D52_15195 [Nocardia yunnanensis]
MISPTRRGDPRSARAGFTGPIVRCTHWRDQHELDRLHVAVIGGGTALARIVPPVVDQARRVTVFQHDPIWILPTPPLPGAGSLLRRLPAGLVIPARFRPESVALGGSVAGVDPGQKHAGMTEGARARRTGEVLRQVAEELLRQVGEELLRRAAGANLRVQVRDPWQRRLLTPDHRAAVRVHGRYYRALGRANCRLVSWPIARLAPLGVRTVDGVEHRVDCIIYAEDML